MTIRLIGMNHATAPVEVREQIAFSSEGVGTALLLFHQQYPDCEAAIISTCNRVEMLVSTPSESPTANDIVSFIAQSRDVPVKVFRHYLYEYQGEQAIRHLFRVTGGLDSMALGESQIVNQLKNAYALASEQGTTGRLLNRLFHCAFSVGKRIRSETEIGQRKTSVSSVAVDLITQEFHDMENKHLLVIGAGEMAQLTCQYLRKMELKRFSVTSRTLSNVQALAKACGAVAVPYEQLDTALAQADIVITATRCPSPILTVERIARIQQQRDYRPLFIVDLSVPRNVEAAVEDIANVHGYDIDALGRIVAENKKHCRGQLVHCEAILDEEIENFQRWLAHHHNIPVIEQMYIDARQLRDSEMYRLLCACPDLTQQQIQQVGALADRLINKLMHPCVNTVKQCGRCDRSATLADTLHDIAENLRRDVERKNAAEL